MIDNTPSTFEKKINFVNIATASRISIFLFVGELAAGVLTTKFQIASKLFCVCLIKILRHFDINSWAMCPHTWHLLKCKFRWNCFLNFEGMCNLLVKLHDYALETYYWLLHTMHLFDSVILGSLSNVLDNFCCSYFFTCIPNLWWCSLLSIELAQTLKHRRMRNSWCWTHQDF